MNKKKNNFIPKIIKFKKYYNKTGTLVPFENSNKNLKIGNNCPIKIRRIFFSTAKKIHLEEIMLINFVHNY